MWGRRLFWTVTSEDHLPSLAAKTMSKQGSSLFSFRGSDKLAGEASVARFSGPVFSILAMTFK